MEMFQEERPDKFVETIPKSLCQTSCVQGHYSIQTNTVARESARVMHIAAGVAIDDNNQNRLYVAARLSLLHRNHIMATLF